MNYAMPDGTVVKTENAIQTWDSYMILDNGQHVDINTRSVNLRQVLHMTRKRRYWLEWVYSEEHSRDRAEWLSKEAACRWLLLNDKAIPYDLRELKDEAEE